MSPDWRSTRRWCDIVDLCTGTSKLEQALSQPALARQLTTESRTGSLNACSNPVNIISSFVGCVYGFIYSV
jgi:hypothetical protein